jgi:hypothetical protein
VAIFRFVLYCTGTGRFLVQEAYQTKETGKIKAILSYLKSDVRSTENVCGYNMNRPSFACNFWFRCLLSSDNTVVRLKHCTKEEKRSVIGFSHSVWKLVKVRGHVKQFNMAVTVWVRGKLANGLGDSWTATVVDFDFGFRAATDCNVLLLRSKSLSVSGTIEKLALNKVHLHGKKLCTNGLRTKRKCLLSWNQETCGKFDQMHTEAGKSCRKVRYVKILHDYVVKTYNKILWLASVYKASLFRTV